MRMSQQEQGSLLADMADMAATKRIEPSVDVAKVVEVAQVAAARAPQAETLLDTILRDEEPLQQEDLEKRMILMNKGMRKCGLTQRRDFSSLYA
jgi:hypothetical protein